MARFFFFFKKGDIIMCFIRESKIQNLNYFLLALCALP